MESEKQEGTNLETQVAKKSRGGVAFRCSRIKSSSYVARKEPLHLSVCSPPPLVATSSLGVGPVCLSPDERQLLSLTVWQSSRNLIG